MHERCSTLAPGDPGHRIVPLPDSTVAEVREGRSVTRRSVRCLDCGQVWEEVR